MNWGLLHNTWYRPCVDMLVKRNRGWKNLEVVIFIRDGGTDTLLEVFEFLAVPLHVVLVDVDVSGGESRGFTELKVGITICVRAGPTIKTLIREQAWGIPGKTASEPEEGLLKVVVGAGRDVEVGKVLTTVESDVGGLNLAVLDVNLVTAENDGDVLADTILEE